MPRSEFSSEAHVEAALERATDPAGEGLRVFLHVDVKGARQAATAADRQIRAGLLPSRIAGLPVSVKDLFDVRGQVTTAASPSQAGAAPAARDCTVVARLKRAGAVIVGRTNMTEFAFTGVGMNPHYGTPANAYDRAARRIPGGSSSGAAVSVTDGMAVAAIGSDTGGSVRIPAALCGIVGFKPTQRRIPLDGVFPLSPSLDSIGVMARTVAECAAFDAVIAGEDEPELKPANLEGLTAAIPRNYFLDSMEAAVARAFERAVAILHDAGVRCIETDFPEAEEIAAINSRGGFAAAEAYRYHQEHGTDLSGCDPRVCERLVRGAAITDADYREMRETRAAIIERFDSKHAGMDMMVCPVNPIVAPEIRALKESADEFRRVNALLLRNPSIVNFLDRCAVSLPCHEEGEAPIGLMVTGRRAGDRALLSIAAALEERMRD